MNRWLYLDDGPAPGAENMARDELLFEEAARGSPPVLRLYSFEPPAITIGFHQDFARVLDEDAVRADGISCVRRVTGGRVLLHDGELTYCVAASSRRGELGTRTAEAHRRISESIAAALRSIGVEAEVSRGRERAPAGAGTPPCLSSVSRYELTARGRKIAASAQRRTAAAFLQHGSILIRPGSEAIGRYVRGSWGSIDRGVTSVSEELGRPADAAALRLALAKSFAEMFNIEWRPLRLTDRDEEEVRRRALAKAREWSDMFAREVCSP